MRRFECDYAEGAHPRLLARLVDTNEEQTPGYGTDSHCERARALIREQCRREDVDVHFLMGGTPCNLTLLTAALRPHQGALAAQSGHIAVHESGAIEAAGHKVLPLPAQEGRVSAAQVRDYCARHFGDHNREHTVQPGLLYISQPTESGTLYSKAELEALSDACREWGLYLYVDGARLSYALAAPGNDVTIADLAALADAFYIGGTKVGALFGEAMVITAPALKKDFRYILKQRGSMLAKGRLLGVQFETLFEDGLYMDIGRHAVEQALRIREAFANKGIPFLCESPTNQQFPLLTSAQCATLEKEFVFEHWETRGDGRVAVRFCTSWATTPQSVDALCAAIDRL